MDENPYRAPQQIGAPEPGQVNHLTNLAVALWAVVLGAVGFGIGVGVALQVLKKPDLLHLAGWGCAALGACLGILLGLLRTRRIRGNWARVREDQQRLNAEIGLRRRDDSNIRRSR